MSPHVVSFEIAPHSCLSIYHAGRVLLFIDDKRTDLTKILREYLPAPVKAAPAPMLARAIQ
jgi:hypothetical protein